MPIRARTLLPLSLLLGALTVTAACGTGGGGGSCTSKSDCADDEECSSGRCVPVEGDGGAGCPTGQMSCAGSCVDPSTDVNHCGACGNACAAGPRGTATCMAGSCSLSCEDGFADCNGVGGDGCEAELAADPANCGTCGNACTAPAGAAPTCESGSCGWRCREGFADCDGDPANGCETSTADDPANCGACDTTCTDGPNGTAACTGGSCTLRCEDGFADCNGEASDGCEATLATDRNHCGACGNACDGGMVCQDGSCVDSPFGTGADGELTVSGTVELPRTAVRVLGPAGGTRVTLIDPALLRPGQLVMLHQSRGGADAQAGTWRLRRVAAVEGLTVTLDEALDVDFVTSTTGSDTHVAQLLLVPEYTRVVVQNRGVLRARAWDGRTGGILAFLASEGVEVAAGGLITAGAAGYRGGASPAWTGGGEDEPSRNVNGMANGVGGGSRLWNTYYYIGGGGGHAGAGGRGYRNQGPPGAAYAATDGLLLFGGGGGGGRRYIGVNGPGGAGGGVVWFATPSVTLAGAVHANGAGGGGPAVPTGGGAGGTVWIRTEGPLALGTNLVGATGGRGGVYAGSIPGGGGGPGRIVIYLGGASPSISGSTNPMYELHVDTGS